MKKEVEMPEKKNSKEPEVELRPPTNEIMDTVVATARTCYAKRIILPGEVSKDETATEIANKIQQATKDAGHNTTRLHKSLTFTLNNVSRQFIWSFLHSHPFYNSEQVSQRYVDVKPGSFFVPELNEKELEIYNATTQRQMDAYKKLAELLTQTAEAEYFNVFPGRKHNKEKWLPAVHKKAIEVARYILPIATLAHLYHTISPLTLIRYKRMCEASDVPTETRTVVDKMVQETLKADRRFEKDLDDTIPLEETLEYKCFREFHKGQHPTSEDFIKEFDAGLEGRSSKLAGYTTNAEEIIAKSVRTALGLTKAQMTNEDAIRLALDAQKNQYLGEVQNVMTLSKINKALHNISYTFEKKISHTADSQDQRHRMTPAARPMIATHYTGKADFITPALITRNEQARELYAKEINFTFEAINQLLNNGVSTEKALYLLPNAFPIRFVESGDLVNWHHKWKNRLCYLAQEEIWKTSQEEVEQVTAVHPQIGKYIHAPCWQRKHAKETPFCPERDRYCGVPVWNLEVKDFKRIL